MEWRDTAIILSARRHGERSLIMHLLTKEHGRHAGLFKEPAKQRGIHQPGNIVQATWKARLEEHLGTWYLEPESSSAAAFLGDSLRLGALSSACSLLDATLPEREAHPALFTRMHHLLVCLQQDAGWQAAYVFLELELLRQMGFGLDLGTCAATGSHHGLTYVSPKSGCAVSKDAGKPYHSRLLLLPSFLLGEKNDEKSVKKPIDLREIVDGLALTRYFLEKHIFITQGSLPAARERFSLALQNR